MHPDEKRFTWTSGSRPTKFARLDFFLVSDSLMPYVDSTKIAPGIQSDHSMISISIDFNRFHRGRGFFKFNNSLLKDAAYISLVKSNIKDLVREYSEVEYTDNEFNELSPEQLQALPLNINPQLFFDLILMKIRGETIKYCSNKKKNVYPMRSYFFMNWKSLSLLFTKTPTILAFRMR